MLDNDTLASSAGIDSGLCRKIQGLLNYIVSPRGSEFEKANAFSAVQKLVSRLPNNVMAADIFFDRAPAPEVDNGTISWMDRCAELSDIMAKAVILADTRREQVVMLREELAKVRAEMDETKQALAVALIVPGRKWMVEEIYTVVEQYRSMVRSTDPTNRDAVRQARLTLLDQCRQATGRSVQWSTLRARVVAEPSDDEPRLIYRRAQPAKPAGRRQTARSKQTGQAIAAKMTGRPTAQQAAARA
jgi:hypothetical protein